MFTPFVSVIIPVYNDAVRLRTCLQALEEQTYPKERYEVIVVDNGSDESIEPVVAEFKQAKASYEAQSGSYAARNRGIALAQGEIFAFTDSDCIPEPNWIENGVKHLLNMPKPGIVGGNVQLFFQNPEHPTAVELFDAVVMKFDQKANIEENLFSVTANLFTFKRIVDQVGDFDNELKSRGDVEWGNRVASSGYTFHYAADVRIAHPARRSFARLHQRMIRLTGGFEDLTRKNEALILKRERQEFSLSLVPSFKTFLLIWQSPLTVLQKIKVIVVGAVVKFIKVWERARLKLWGKAAR